MSNVSLVDGHIDRGQVTPREAIEFFKNEIAMLKYAPEINGCEMTEEWKRQLEICKLAISALEKQIPKKVMFESDLFKLRYCPCCKVRFIGWGMRYCGECGQALDWSEAL